MRITILYLIASLVLVIWGFLYFGSNLSADFSDKYVEFIPNVEKIVKDDDIFNASLLLTQQYCKGINIEKANKVFDEIVAEIKKRIKSTDDPMKIIKIISDYLFIDYQIQPDSSLTIEHLLPYKVLETRKGHCVGLSLLYLAIGERLNLPIYAKKVPSHMYVCYDDGFTKFNIETTLKGFPCDDDYYSYHFPFPERHSRIKKMSNREILGGLLTNLGCYLRQDPHVLEIQNKALFLDPNSPEIHTNIGFCFLDHGDMKEAKKHLLKAIELDPSSWQAYFGMGNIYYENGDCLNASNYYTHAISLLRKSAKILSPYQYGLPKKKKLIELADKMVKSENVPCKDLLAYGIGLCQYGEYELSNEIFCHALNICAKQPEVHIYCAITDIYLGNYLQARKHIQFIEISKQEKTLDNNSPIFLLNTIADCYMRLGQCCALRKEYELALNNFYKAIEVGGLDSRFYCSIAETYLLRGDRLQAVNYYKKAMELDPLNKQIQKKIINLQSDKIK